MKFEIVVEINCPRDKVVALFRDIDGMKTWQDNFLGKELLSGELDQNGSKALITYKFGKGIMELKETVLDNSLPDHFEGLYEHKSMTNTMRSVFVDLSKDKTRFESFYEYTIFNGIIPKLMSWIMPGMFRKQSKKWMLQFKDFVEKETIVK